ncbi:uncharacterized protein EDB93DRAFT_1260184 [Suillus bovinus]|uniref:uncharacterized protein n=1 Tax=Suillus bovinus TaxID=48563 RepID=UPI001B877C62|nr:uncharacterized protein EDB93DRAFT_1260184 [Suillus bovinus]KAG2159783.1 hypothetical protein EDB93DRAFT_1260184 [Suillus bovinus]
MSQSLQGGQGTMIPLSQPILQSTWLPSREEMLFEVIPVNILSEHLHLICNFQILIHHSPATTSPRKTLLAPHIIVSHPEANLSRHLKISTPPPLPSHQTHQGKLNTDPIPMRYTTEPESISNATSSSSPPRTPPLPIRETLQQVVNYSINYSITGRMILYDLQFLPIHRQPMPTLRLHLNHQETISPRL